MFKQALLIGVFMVFTLALTSNAQASGGIGYEYLDGGEVIHIWNNIDDYYLNASSGIQITNYYDEYWTHNTFCLGYNSGSWSYYCTDDLPVTLTPATDGSTYVQVNGTRSFTVAGRTIIFGIDYYLELNDDDLNVTVGARNTGGGDISNEIGFAWRTDDIKIGNTYDYDVIKINFSTYDLSDTLDLTFDNLTWCGDDGFGGYECISKSSYTLEDRNPIYPSLSPTNFTRLSWNENLNYFVQLKSGSQPNAHVTTVLKTTGLNVGQTKQTTFQWKDPIWEINATTGEGWYHFQEFNIQPLASSWADDDEFSNESNANCISGQCISARDNGETGTVYGYFWRGGFTEGIYTIANISDLRQGSSHEWKANVSFGVDIDCSGDLNYYDFGSNDGEATWDANSTDIRHQIGSATADNNGWGMPICVNSSGILAFHLFGNGTDPQVGVDIRLQGIMIVNYTESSGEPPVADTTDPYWTYSDGNKTHVYAYDGSANDYTFNISAYDDNSSVDTVSLCHEIGSDWTCVPMVNDSATNFYTTVTKSVKGNTTYKFMFVVNDTAGNSNSTGNYTYLVNQRSLYGGDNITLEFNSTEGSQSWNYGNWSNISAYTPVTGTTGIVLYRNGVIQSGASQIVLLGYGSYNYTVELAHENYTWSTGPILGSPKQLSYTLTINSLPTGLDLSISPSPTVVEGTEITATCVNTTGAITLFVDGVSQANPYTATLSLGTYNVSCISALTGNYSPLYEEIELNVQASGFGCTNTTTYAFEKTYTNIGPNWYTLDFSDLVDANQVKSDLSDVIIDNESIDTFVNFTDGYYFVINTTYHENFTISFGNYYINNTYNQHFIANDTNVSGYTSINPAYTIHMLNEISGATENPDNATESMTIYCTGGSTTFTIQNDTTVFTLATVEQPTSLKMFVSYSNTEQYWREQLVRGTTEFKYFYLADANEKQVAEILLEIDDYTGTYGQGDLLAVKKWIEGSLQVITEGYFDVEAKTINYLIVGEKYSLYVDDGVTEVSIGELLVDTNDLTKTIIIGEFALTDELLGHIQYNLSMNNDTGAIQFFYYDPTNTTLNVTMEIWNYSNQSQLIYSTYSENHTSVNFNYVVPDVNQSYKVEVHVAHTYFGEDSFLDIVRVFTGLATFIVNPFGSIPANILIGVGTVSLIGVAITFGGRQGGVAGIIVGITALLYVFLGWYSIPIGIGVLALVLAVFNKFREVKS